MVSVALSVASLRLGVTQHPALWSPDFPPRLCRSGRPALLTYPSIRPWAAALTRLVHPHPGLPPSRGKESDAPQAPRLWIPACAGMTGQGGEGALKRALPPQKRRWFDRLTMSGRHPRDVSAPPPAPLNMTTSLSPMPRPTPEGPHPNPLPQGEGTRPGMLDSRLRGNDGISSEA